MTHVRRVRTMASVLVAITLMVFLLCGSAFDASANNHRKIVRFRPITKSLLCLVPGSCIDLNTEAGMNTALAAVSGAKVLQKLSFVNALGVEFPDDDNVVAKLLKDLLTKAFVIEVVDDLLTRVDSICPLPTQVPPLLCPPDLDCYPWGMQASETVAAHTSFPLVQGSEVKVAIVDTGINEHIEFGPNRLIAGFNALPESHPEGPWPPIDSHGHGTAMAGIIGANIDLLPGIVGVAPEVLLVPVKAFDAKGEGLLSDVANALQWVLNNNIPLVSMSFGFPFDNPVLKDAIRALYTGGVIMVASAGNSCSGPTQDDGGGADCRGGPTASCQNGLTTLTYPAAYSNWVLSVGAVRKATNPNPEFEFEVADYSLSGSKARPLDVVAPGGDWVAGGLDLLKDRQIVSTLGGLPIPVLYGRGHGTSHAAAHAAGGVALLLQLASDLNESLPFATVRSILQTTATPFKDDPPERQGAGLINIKEMLDELSGLNE